MELILFIVVGLLGAWKTAADSFSNCSESESIRRILAQRLEACFLLQVQVTCATQGDCLEKGKSFTIRNCSQANCTNTLGCSLWHLQSLDTRCLRPNLQVAGAIILPSGEVFTTPHNKETIVFRPISSHITTADTTLSGQSTRMDSRLLETGRTLDGVFSTTSSVTYANSWEKIKETSSLTNSGSPSQFQLTTTERNILYSVLGILGLILLALLFYFVSRMLCKRKRVTTLSGQCASIMEAVNARQLESRNIVTTGPGFRDDVLTVNPTYLDFDNHAYQILDVTDEPHVYQRSDDGSEYYQVAPDYYSEIPPDLLQEESEIRPPIRTIDRPLPTPPTV